MRKLLGDFLEQEARPAPFFDAAQGNAFTFPSEVIFRGEMILPGNAVIDHRHDGFIEADKLLLGGNANVTGTIMARGVDVAGRFQGEIFADHIILRPSARVEGELYFATFSIESGAWFEGKTRRVAAPRDLLERSDIEA